MLNFNQDLPINYIPHNKKIRLSISEANKINIDGYPHNPITNQEELDKYMKYQLQFFKIGRNQLRNN